MILPDSYSHSAEYADIEGALKSLWQPYQVLSDAMHSFVPRPLDDYDAERQAQFDHLVQLNPSAPHDSLRAAVDAQIKIRAEPRHQFHRLFHKAMSAQSVLISLTAYALCEAVTNVALALACQSAGQHAKFSKLEKQSLRAKWCQGIPSLLPDSPLSVGPAVLEVLDALVRWRHSLTHSKIELEVHGVKVFSGSARDRSTYESDLVLLAQFFRLPYRLNQCLWVAGLPQLAVLSSSYPIPDEVA